MDLPFFLSSYGALPGILGEGPFSGILAAQAGSNVLDLYGKFSRFNWPAFFIDSGRETMH